MKRAWALLSLVMLSGCSTYSLEELRHAEPQGTAFQKALAREYLNYAAEQEQSYNWSVSWHFADKGLMAAYGNDVGPENVPDKLSLDDAAALAKARDDLLTVLAPAMVEAEPMLAARAYMQFDCWAQRVDDGWLPEKIAQCHNGFDDALHELQTRAAQATSAMGGPEISTTSYLVLFDWNRATLNTAGKQIVGDVLATLAGEEGYEIILNGHTDTTGLEKFNLTLSKKRAESVAAALEHGGIDKDRIKVFAFGESDPAVPTADNVDEPKNRRVEIFIQ